MRETNMKRQGYNYYVYVCPGVIEYFFNRSDAEEFAMQHGAEVKVVS